MSTVECPKNIFGESECAAFLRATTAAVAASKGERCEITVSIAPPLVIGAYGINGYTCPHGVDYWIEPTSEQIADWAARGVQ